jgi:hypothetical protein
LTRGHLDENMMMVEVHLMSWSRDMCTRKKLNEILGLKDRLEDEQKRFVQRVNQLIFHRIYTDQWQEFDYDALFDAVCFELGTDSHTFPRRNIPRLRASAPAPITDLTGGEFHKTLEVLCALYAHIEFHDDEGDGPELLSQLIEAALSRCTCDIGVRWKEGLFYPSGAKELDEPLIGEVLTWLKGYPNEEKDYRAALHHYMTGDSLPDVVKDCYSAVEGIARSILGNTTRLDKNVDALLAKIGLSDGWKQVLTDYVKYAHDYRHADPVRHDITSQEAEAYLYMTGLIIRLTIESKKPDGKGEM